MLTDEDRYYLTIGANVYAKAMEIACGMATKIQLGKYVETYKLECESDKYKLARNSIIQEVIDKLKNLPDPILSIYDRGPDNQPGNSYVTLNKAIIISYIEKMM